MRLCVLTNLGISGSYLGIILPIVNGGGPIAMFLPRNYFRGLPPEIYESAKLDGAAELRIWAQIYMPLNIPALTYLGINGFIVGFKEWVLPLLTVQNDRLVSCMICKRDPGRPPGRGVVRARPRLGYPPRSLVDWH